MLGGVLLALPAYAQNAAPLSPPGAADSGQGASLPTRDPGVTTAPAVIHPGNPDPGMSVMPPSTGATQVIRPPGSSGNPSTIVPK